LLPCHAMARCDGPRRNRPECGCRRRPRGVRASISRPVRALPANRLGAGDGGADRRLWRIGSGLQLSPSPDADRGGRGPVCQRALRLLGPLFAVRALPVPRRRASLMQSLLDTIAARLPGIVWPPIIEGSAATVLALARQLDASQWFAPEELRAKQFAQLGLLIPWLAAHSPAFARRLQSAGIGAGELASPE